MENLTFYKQINLFLENKGQRNPRSTYIGKDLRTQARSMHMHTTNLRT